MRQRRLWALGFGLWLAASGGPASAQSTYVAGAIGAEVVRTASTRSGSSTYDSGSGEAPAGAIRVGTLVAPHFGVEIEYFRPGRIDADANGPIYLAAFSADPIYSQLLASGLYPDATIPSIIGQKTRVRTTTTSALAFGRQEINSRFELVYLGGIGFSRVVRDIEYSISRLVVPIGPASAQPYTSRTTQYGVGPVVGVEGRIGMTEHARLVAGLRAHALGQSLVDGWMIRPSVGLAWMF